VNEIVRVNVQSGRAKRFCCFGSKKGIDLSVESLELFFSGSGFEEIVSENICGTQEGSRIMWASFISSARIG